MGRVWLAALLILLASAARAQEDGGTLLLVERGSEILERDCSGCHAVGREGDSPLAKAPRFRELARHFPIEGLAEALAEGIMTGHPEMPERVYQPADIDAILAYLESIQTQP